MFATAYATWTRACAGEATRSGPDPRSSATPGGRGGFEPGRVENCSNRGGGGMRPFFTDMYVYVPVRVDA